MTDSVACDVAKAKGADIIIAVNLQRDVKNNQIDSLVDIIAQSVSIMTREISKTKLVCADVVIEPDTKGISMFDFSQKKVLMDEGIKAAKNAVPRIKELIAKYQ